MSELGLIVKDSKVVVNSLTVAEKYEKQHAHVMRDIRNIIEAVPEGLSNFGETYYLDSQGKKQPSIDMDRQGFSMLVMGFTGDKARRFTYQYTLAFEQMAQSIKQGGRTSISAETKNKEIEARLNNSLVRKVKELRKIIDDPSTPPTYRQVLNSTAVEMLTGQKLLPLPETEKTYSATEIAEMVGSTANMVGRVAGSNDLKTDEYGVLVWDKSPYSAKQVQSFRYNEKGKERLKVLFEGVTE